MRPLGGKYFQIAGAALQKEFGEQGDSERLIADQRSDNDVEDDGPEGSEIVGKRINDEIDDDDHSTAATSKGEEDFSMRSMRDDDGQSSVGALVVGDAKAETHGENDLGKGVSKEVDDEIDDDDRSTAAFSMRSMHVDDGHSSVRAIVVEDERAETNKESDFGKEFPMKKALRA